MLYYRKVEEIFKKTGSSLTLIQTEYRNHAYEFILKLEQNELLKYSAILVVSGDGLVHEILNAIYNREDKSIISENLPIGHLPGGSGNALYWNTCFFSKDQIYDFESSIYFVIKGETKSLNIFELENSKNEKIYCFLSFYFAFIADVDIHSEFLRFLGGLRFDVYGAWRLFKRLRYDIKFYFTEEKINKEQMPQITDDISQLEGWKTIEDSFIYFGLQLLPYPNKNMKVCPTSQPEDGLSDFIAFKSTLSAIEFTKIMFSMNNNADHIKIFQKQCNTESIFQQKVKAFRFEPKRLDTGVVSIDGERFDTDVYQGFVIENAIKIFTY